jgi:hypothetical protein
MLVTVVVPNAELPGQEQSEQQIGKPRFTISRETTFVSGPLRADGSVDFAAAINARLSEGVTAENNACTLLYQAFGPSPGGAEMPRAFFEQLQMRRPPPEGQYLQTLSDAVRDRNLSNEEFHQLFKQQDAARRRPWTRAEFPIIADWLDQNKEPLRRVHTAVRRDRYFSPLVVGDEDAEGPLPLIAVLLPGAQAARSVARLLCTRAMLHLGEDNRQAAWNDLLASHRLGRLVGMGPTVVEALVGHAIEGMTIEAEVVFIRDAQPTAAQASEYRKSLDVMPPIARMSEKVNLSERCNYLDALLVMAWNRQEAVELLGVEEGLAPMSRVINTLGLKPTDWDAALRTGNAWYDRLVASLELPTFGERRAAYEKIQKELKAGTRIENAAALIRDAESDIERDSIIAQTIGDLVAALLLPALDRARIAEDRVRQCAGNLSIALALAAFHADHTQYPEKLDELVPTYLAVLPEDIFSGQAPVYRRKGPGYLLYSVGENTRDDGGRTFGEAPAGDDLPVRITKTPQ